MYIARKNIILLRERIKRNCYFYLRTNISYFIKFKNLSFKKEIIGYLFDKQSKHLFDWYKNSYLEIGMCLQKDDIR